MKLKMRDKKKEQSEQLKSVSPIPLLQLSNVIFIIIISGLMNLVSNAHTLNILETNNSVNVNPNFLNSNNTNSSSNDSSSSSYVRIKRQLFRQNIPQHRPLSGNLYAEHHGFPHPGRWHENPQGIVPENLNSGHHFENPNLILNDDDFNRYGSTLQHIDEMIYQQRLREQGNLPLQQLRVEGPQQISYGPAPVINTVEPSYGPAPVEHPVQTYGPVPLTPIHQPVQTYGPVQQPQPVYGPAPIHQYGPPQQNFPTQYQPPPPPPPQLPSKPHYHHQQPHPHRPPAEYGQIHIIPDNNLHHLPSSGGHHGPDQPEIIHHGSPNPVIPVVAHFHYNHQLGALKGSQTVKYLPGSITQHGQQHQQQSPPLPPPPKPQYGAELQLPQYDVIGEEEFNNNHASEFGIPAQPPTPFKLKATPLHRLKGPQLFNIRQPKQFNHHQPIRHNHKHNNYGSGAYLPVRKPVRYSTQIPGAYSWSVSY